MKTENGEILMELLEQNNIEIPLKVAIDVAEDFKEHLSEVNSMYSNQFISSESKPKENIEALKRENEELKAEILIYKESVMKRRNASFVYTENGTVKYDL